MACWQSAYVGQCHRSLCPAHTSQLCLQADAALMPFFERFRLCLQLGQEVDFAKVQGGTIAAWLVSHSHLHS